MPRQLLLDLDGLQVKGSWSRPIDGIDEYIDVAISANAFPFSGTVETIFRSDDLSQFSDALGSLGVSGKAVLGGGRAAYLGLDVTDLIGGEASHLTLEVTLIPSEDGGWPKLSFLIFGVDPGFTARSAAAITEFLRRRD
jgi:hypothetical protein